MTRTLIKGCRCETITSDRLATFIRLLSLVIPLQQLPIIIIAAGDRGAPLLFNSGDEFSIRKVLIGLDQNGRGKGDLVKLSRSAVLA